MKSSKAYVTKASVKQFRLGMLSLLALMVLSLSVGRAVLAADDAELWHAIKNSDGKVTWKKVATEGDDEHAIKLLNGTSTRKADLFRFVLETNNEPVLFIKHLQAAALAKLKKGGFEDWRKNLLSEKGLNNPKIDGVVWKENRDGKKTKALKRLLEDVLGDEKLSDKEAKEKLTKRLEDKDLAKKLLKDEKVREDLGLLDHNPASADEKSVEKQLKEAKESFEKALADRDKAAAEREARLRQAFADATKARRVGEYSNQDFEDYKHRCQAELEKALEQQKRDSLAQLEALKDEYRAQMAQLAEASHTPPAVREQGEEKPDFGQTLAQLLANRQQDKDLEQLARRDNNQTLAAAAPQPQAEAQDPGQSLAAPPATPPAGPQQDPNAAFDPVLASMMNQPSAITNGPDVPPSLAGFPTVPDTTVEEAVAADNENLTALVGQQLNAATTPKALDLLQLDLAQRQSDIETSYKSATAKYKQLKAQASAIEQKGAEQLLSASAKTELANLETQYEDAKNRVSQMNQQLAAAGQGGGQAAANAQRKYMPLLSKLNNEASSAKNRLTQYKKRISALVEDGNGKLQMVKQALTDQGQLVSSLKSELGTVTKQSMKIQEAADRMNQMQIMAAQRANAPRNANVLADRAAAAAQQGGSQQVPTPRIMGGNQQMPTAMRSDLGAVGGKGPVRR